MLSLFLSLALALTEGVNNWCPSPCTVRNLWIHGAEGWLYISPKLLSIPPQTYPSIHTKVKIGVYFIKINHSGKSRLALPRQDAGWSHPGLGHPFLGVYSPVFMSVQTCCWAQNMKHHNLIYSPKHQNLLPGGAHANINKSSIFTKDLSASLHRNQRWEEERRENFGFGSLVHGGWIFHPINMKFRGGFWFHLLNSISKAWMHALQSQLVNGQGIMDLPLVLSAHICQQVGGF